MKLAMLVFFSEADADVFGIDPRDLRLQNAVRKIAPDLRNGVADVIDSTVGWCAEHELNECRAVALADRAADFLDAGDATDRRFDPLRNLRFQLVRGSARLADGNDRGREIDIRRIVHLHPGKGNQAKQHQADEQHDRPNRVLNAPGRDVPEIHDLIAFLSGP